MYLQKKVDKLKKIFLTSSPGGSYKDDTDMYYPEAFDNRNGFVDKLKAALPGPVHCLMMSSAPQEHMINDSYKAIYEAAFALSDMALASMALCDDRNTSELDTLLGRANLVILCGGHVPTQNRFFADIGLRERLASYEGVIVGVSAGSMNSAVLVYAQPELEGEATDPGYRRFIPGLGLTEIRILPHFKELRELTLDGMNIITDIALTDSKQHDFYGLVDGSYILCEGDKAMLYGEGYCFSGGNMEQVCRESGTLELSGSHD